MERLRNAIGFEKFGIKDVWNGVGISLIYTLTTLIYYMVAGGLDSTVVIGIITLGMMLMAFELNNYKQDLGLIILAVEEIVSYFTIGASSIILVCIAAIVLAIYSIKNGTGILNTRNKIFKTKLTHKILFYCTVFAYIADRHNWLVTNYVNDGTIDMSIITTLYSCLPLAVIFSYVAYLDVFKPIYAIYNIVLVIVTYKMFNTDYVSYTTLIYTIASVSIYLKLQGRYTRERLEQDLNDFEPIKLNATEKDIDDEK